MDEIRRFLYLGPSLNLNDLQKSKPLIARLNTTVKTLIGDNKAPSIITELVNYHQAYSAHFQTYHTRNNLECLTLLLAACLQPTVDELFANSGTVSIFIEKNNIYHRSNKAVTKAKLLPSMVSEGTRL